MKHLHAHACEILREEGHHTVVCNVSSSQTPTVPRHQEVKEFVARKKCRDLGIPEP